MVVVAAGRGTRFGGETPKQYQPIAGVPMVLRAVRPFAAHPDVAQVALVLPPADAEAPPAFLRGVAGAGLVVVAGGAERADSVAAGLRGARPGSAPWCWCTMPRARSSSARSSTPSSRTPGREKAPWPRCA